MKLRDSFLTLSAAAGLALLRCASFAISAPLATYDSITDWAPGPGSDGLASQTSATWRYQSAFVSNFDGPYTDLPYFDDPGEWLAGNPGADRVFIGPSSMHPGFGGQIDRDPIHAFRAPVSGRYLILGTVRHADTTSGGGQDGVELNLYRGNASGNDTPLGNAAIAFQVGSGIRVGSGSMSVQTLEAADIGTGQDQIYLRVTDRSNVSNDSSEVHHRIYRLAENVAPSVGNVWNSQTQFGTGANTFGQVGDVDQLANPTWFYQEGTPGTQANYHLLSDRVSNQWQNTPDAIANLGGYSYLSQNATNVHPGTDNSHSVIRSWSSSFAGVVDLSYTAADADPNGGDGVTINVYKNDVLLSSLLKSNGFVSSTTSLSNVSVLPGDFIHFAILPNGNHFNDNTAFVASITAISVVPEPSVGILLLGFAACLARLRRRF